MLAAVGGFAEAGAGLAVLGVGFELVLDVGDGTGGVAAVELEGAVAVLAAELGVSVDEGIGEGLHLPEGFISAAGADATTFDFALVELLRWNDDFGGHVAFLRANLLGGGSAVLILRCIGGFSCAADTSPPLFPRKIFKRDELGVYRLWCRYESRD